MAHSATVIDEGPIPYAKIDLFGDIDLEQILTYLDYVPLETAYRLIEISLNDIGELAAMPKWRLVDRSYVDALRGGTALPPIVVLRTPRGWTLLDGVHRTQALLELGVPTVRAYELLTASPQAPDR